MSFSSDNGYIASTFDTLMQIVMTGINTQYGLSYTYDSFVGTNYYKIFYPLVQRLQESEVKTAEITLLLQDYFAVTNEAISRPANTPPGIIEQFKIMGYIASLKPPADADAGKLFVCVNVDSGDDDYDAQKLAICQKLAESCVVGGVVTQGDQVESITFSNGQSFDYKFALPAAIPVKLKLTTTLSENNQFVILSPEEQKQILINNIEANYSLGKNFEPQRYFSLADAPWASDVKLEWSSNAGSTWHTTVYNADFDDLFTYSLADITLIEA